MKRIKKTMLTIFSMTLLAITSAALADQTPKVSSDGFLILTLEEPVTTVIKKSSTTRKIKKIASKRKSTKKRKIRKKRSIAKTRRTYRVRRGDTLTNIAKKTRTNFSKLVRLNHLYGARKHQIVIGQRLRLR